MRGSTQNLGSIGSAVLSFIGYKRTDIQTDIHAKYIYICCGWIIFSVPVDFEGNSKGIESLPQTQIF